MPWPPHWAPFSPPLPWPTPLLTTGDETALELELPGWPVDGEGVTGALAWSGGVVTLADVFAPGGGCAIAPAGVVTFGGVVTPVLPPTGPLPAVTLSKLAGDAAGDEGATTWLTTPPDPPPDVAEGAGPEEAGL